ncbi:lipoprotein, putative [Microscilla marina ATCC 23134]|uniref:Lipoprotein, putative n=1 Tax=Microscilla marina ATCC 23134 TaxID=313606 RepID=A1ZZ11_MICM2|nr:lipoprotein, putative [Microscilla marina ATCC 23134]
MAQKAIMQVLEGLVVGGWLWLFALGCVCQRNKVQVNNSIK